MLCHPMQFSYSLSYHQSLTSKRRIEDQLPGLPAVSKARARHHMVRVGSVLLLNWEVVTLWLTMYGDGNES